MAKKKPKRGRPYPADYEAKVRLGSLYIPQDCVDYINSLMDQSGESKNVVAEKIIRRDMKRKRR